MIAARRCPVAPLLAAPWPWPRPRRRWPPAPARPGQRADPAERLHGRARPRLRAGTRASGWISTCRTAPPPTRRCWCSSMAATGRAGRRSSTGSSARPSPRGATSPRSRTIASTREVRYPTFIEDGALAVTWLETQPATAGGRQVFLAGHSAGAYIAAMLALDPRWLGEATPARAAGAIAAAGRARRALRLPAAATTRRSGDLRPRPGEPGLAADQPCGCRRSADAAGDRHHGHAPFARATASPWPSA